MKRDYASITASHIINKNYTLLQGGGLSVVKQHLTFSPVMFLNLFLQTPRFPELASHVDLDVIFPLALPQYFSQS